MPTMYSLVLCFLILLAACDKEVKREVVSIRQQEQQISCETFGFCFNCGFDGKCGFGPRFDCPGKQGALVELVTIRVTYETNQKAEQGGAPKLYARDFTGQRTVKTTGPCR